MQPTSLTRLRPGFVRASILAAGFLVTALAALAQATSGSVSGRVLNATNGTYLTNARVIVEGTSLEAFTNNFGEFRLDGVPAGTANVKVFYTGLPERAVSVTVAAGQAVTQDFSLGEADAARSKGDVVRLDAFRVASKIEMDAAAIAINEQRFAATIKNVVSTDAFGDITEGNVGDFVKFLPGVTIDYVSPDARTISVRGVPANYTPVTLSGNRVASANSSSKGRTFELEQISINNAGRVEVLAARVEGKWIGVVADVDFEFSAQSPIAIVKNPLIGPDARDERRGLLAYRAEGLNGIDKIPTPTHIVPPTFPRDWIGLGVTGRATVEFFIDEEGRARVPVAIAADHPWLAGAAVAAIVQWRFEPPTRGGQPVLVRAEQVFTFEADAR